MSRRKRGAGRVRGSSGAGTITPPPPGDHLLNTGGVDILTVAPGDQLTNG